MYAQVGDFRVSGGPPTVPLMQILCNTVFSSPKICVRRGPSAVNNGQNLVNVVKERPPHNEWQRF